MHHLTLGKEFLRKGQRCNFRQRSHEKFSVYLLKFKLSQLRKMENLQRLLWHDPSRLYFGYKKYWPYDKI